MRTIWIIHRDAGRRAALTRIAGAGDNTLIGHPADELFASATPADAVVLALSGDFELELQFAHRMAGRLRDGHWILLAEPADMAEARRLFDTLGAEFLAFPPTPLSLRLQLQRALRRRDAEPLSRRGGRERLGERFARWFRDMEEAPELLRVLDPKLGDVPVLIRGESGTGRSLLARYVHAYTGTPGSRLVHVACAGARRETDLVEALRDAAEPGPSTTVWLDEPDLLAPRLQLRLQDWIEFGPPEGVETCGAPRWVATAGDELHAELAAELGADQRTLEPRLAQALAGVSIALAPLRERLEAIEPFVLETFARWCTAHQQRMRDITPEALEALQQHPWPGNLRELESVLHRTLALTSAETILPVHLRFEGETSHLDVRDYEGDRDKAPVRGAAAGQALPPDAPAGTTSTLNSELLDEDTFPDVEWIEAEPLNDLGPDLLAGPDGATPGATPGPTPGPALDPSGPDALLSESPAEGDASDPHDDATQSDWPRIVSAIAHEIRNPLVSIRTFSELLPRHYEDEEFRTRFSELVGADVRRIEDVMERLQALAEVARGGRESADVSALLEELLEARGEDIAARGLELQPELDAPHARALCDPEPLRAAFEALLDRAIAGASEGSDLYVACKHHDWGLTGEATVRAVVRFRGPEEPLAGGPAFESEALRIDGIAPEEVDLAYVLAEAVIRAQGGSFAVDTTLPGETLIAVDLPASSDAGPEGDA